MNQDLDLTVIEIANKIGLVKPISVRGEFGNSQTIVGYVFHQREPRVSVEISFGACAALMTTIEFVSLVAHEFGHIVNGHVSQLGAWITFRSALLFCDTPLEKLLMPFVVNAVLFRSKRRGHRHEFVADRAAATIAPPAALGRHLLKGEAFDVAIDELYEFGKIGNMEPESDGDSGVDLRRYFSRLTLLEKIQLIRKTFERNRAAFTYCCQLAKKLDKPCVSHPMTRERLKMLGLDWDSVQDSCEFDPHSLIHFDKFRDWAPERSRVIAVPAGKTLVKQSI